MVQYWGIIGKFFSYGCFMPNSSETFNENKLERLLTNKKFKEAEEISNNILEKDKNNTAALNTLAEICKEKGQLHKAQQLLEKSFSINPSVFKTINDLYDLYSQHNDQLKLNELLKKLYNSQNLTFDYFTPAFNSTLNSELENIYPGSSLRRIFKDLKSIFNSLVYMPVWLQKPSTIKEWKETKINLSAFEKVITNSREVLPELYTYLSIKIGLIPEQNSISDVFTILQKSLLIVFEELNKKYAGLKKTNLEQGVAGKEWISKLVDQSEKELLIKFNNYVQQKNIDSVLLHGSLADGKTETGFSDFDVTYVINISTFGGDDQLLKIAENVLESNAFLLSYNPFMHHGPMVTFSDELNWTTEAMFPSVLVKNGVWLKNPVQQVVYVDDGLDFIMPFAAFQDFFEKQFNSPEDFKNPFDIVWWISSVLFLSLLVKQLKEGKSIWKRDLFEKELNSFPEKYGTLLKDISIIRINAAKLIRSKISLPLEINFDGKNPGLILKDYKENTVINLAELNEIGITGDLIDRAKEFFEYSKNSVFYFHYKNKVNKVGELNISSNQQYHFKELPMHLTIDDYEETRNYFLSLCENKRNIVSVYEFGNVKCPGLSDLDFLVVLGKGYEGVPEELKIKNMPGKYAGILSHDPVFIGEDTIEILGAVYPIFNYKKIYGKDLPIKLSTDFSLKNQLSLFTFINLLKYPQDIFYLVKEPEIRWKTILAYLNSFNHIAKILTQLEVPIPESINQCLKFNEILRDNFTKDEISLDLFPEVIQLMIKASADMILIFESLWAEKIPELRKIYNLTERESYINYLKSVLIDKENQSPELPPLLKTLMLSFEKIEDKVDIPTKIIPKLDQFNNEYIRHRLKFISKEISHKRYPDHYTIGNIFQTVTNEFNNSKFSLFTNEYLKKPEFEWFKVKLKAFENESSFNSVHHKSNDSVNCWIWFNILQNKNLDGKVIIVFGGIGSSITWLLSLKGAKVYLVENDQALSSECSGSNKIFNTKVEPVITNNEKIPIRDNAADIVISFPQNKFRFENESYIKEILRILKPNGQFAFSFDSDHYTKDDIDKLILNNQNSNEFETLTEKLKFKEWLASSSSENNGNISGGIILSKRDNTPENKNLNKCLKIRDAEYTAPILFLIFNRPDYTQLVFNEIKKIAPAKLYIAADGARKNNKNDIINCERTKEIANQIDWDCKVERLFRESNLGCKNAVSSAINWFFENEEYGIILEDDILPSKDFFLFCQEMLKKYADDERIMHVAGNNLQFGWRRNSDSYYYSLYGSIWGWATWRRAWKLYDVQMKKYPEFLKENRLYDIFGNEDEVSFRKNTFDMVYSKNLDTWDFQWTFARLAYNGLSIVPNYNLIKNIGFGQEATRTTSTFDKRANLTIEKMNFPIKHPDFIVRDKISDDKYFNNIINPKPNNRDKDNLQRLPKRNILFLRLDAIGDNVLASSVLKEIHNYYKDYKITVLCQDAVAEIYETCPYVENIIRVNRKKITTEKKYLDSVLEKVTGLNPEYIFNSTFSRDNISDYISTFNKTSKTYAYDGDLSNITEQDKSKYDRLYTKLIKNNKEALTELEKHSHFLNGLGIKHERLVPKVWIQKEDEEYSQKIFKENGLQKENTLALFCGAQHSIRLYENWGKAVNKFCLENNFNVILLGSDKDKYINEKNTKDISGRIINLTGKTTIRQTTAIIKNCAIAIGSETGLAHISCSIGTPNVILVGGGHFGRFIPYSGLTSVVTLPLHCFGCNWQCKFGNPFCIKDISPELIYQALTEKLKNHSAKIRVYAQSEYPYDFISYYPKVTDPQKWLKKSSAEIIKFPKADLQPEIYYKTETLNSLNKLKVEENVKSDLIALHEFYINNPKSFIEVIELEKRVINSVSYEKLTEFNLKINNGFTNYLLALSASIHNEKTAIEYFKKSLKYYQNYRALYLNAILFDKLNYLNNAIWFFVELLKLKINESEIKEKIELIKQVLNIKIYNQNRPISDENNLKVSDLYFSPHHIAPDISIILPSKNRAPGAKAFLQSLEYSCYKINYEILLYTGDDLDEDYKKIKRDYNIDKVFFDSDIFNKDEKFSWTKMMRHGFKNASGKWIMYASDDIVVHPFAFNYALSLVNDETIGGISFMHKNTIQDYDGIFKNYGYDFLADRIFINFGLIRKAAYEQVKGFDSDFKFYSGDTDLCWQLLEKNYQIITSEHSLVDHINIEDSIKCSNTSDVYDQDSKMFLRKWVGYLKQFDTPIYRTRYFLQNINKIKDRIYKESIARGFDKEILFALDYEYKKYDRDEHTTLNEIKLSAIISTFNSERFIGECLEDLVNQTLYINGELEIIVIDSASEQNEGRVVSEYQKKYKNIVYQQTTKETIYKAWNRGIKLSKGKYITNANADDRHLPDALEKMSEVLDTNDNYDVVYADIYQTEIENDKVNSSSKKKVIKWPEFDRDILLFGCFIGPQPVWRKSLHEKFGYFDQNLKVVGDYEFWLRISSGSNFYHINEPLGLYLYNPESAEHRNKEITSTEDTLVRNEYITKYINSFKDIERVKNKLAFISQAENLRQYSSDALRLITQREEGIFLEQKILQELKTNNDEDNLRQLSNVIENTDVLINKNFYNEILFLTLGFILLKESKIEKAKLEFEKALNTNPESSRACSGLGEIFYSEENYEAAKTMFEYAVKFDPQNRNAQNRLENLQEIIAAENLTENDIEYGDNKDIEYILNEILDKVYELFALKKYEEAIKALDQTCDLFYSTLKETHDNHLVCAYENLKGFNYLGLNENESARECFENALNLDPESSQACAGLGEVFFLEGKDKEAKVMYEWGLKNNPGNQFALDGLKKINSILGIEETDNSLLAVK